MKKKAKRKSKAATKKSAKKKGTAKAKTETNPAEVRRKVSKMVKSQAVKMTHAVIDKANAGGELAAVKYLFEVASIYPPKADQEQATAEEESLAETLLHRLNIPTEPIVHDEDDEDDASGAAEVGKPAGNEVEEKDSEAGGESKDPVVV